MLHRNNIYPRGKRLNCHYTRYNHRAVQESLQKTQADISPLIFQNDDLMDEFGEGFDPCNMGKNPKDPNNALDSLERTLDCLPYFRNFIEHMERGLR